MTSQDYIIIVQVPHQLPVQVWTAYGWDDAAERCTPRGLGSGPSVTKVTKEEMTALRNIEPGEEGWEEEWAILEKHGAIFEVVQGHPHDSEWFAPGEEPTLEDAVKNFINHDLSNSHFLTSPEDVERYLSQDWPSSVSVAHDAWSIGWLSKDLAVKWGVIEADEEDED